MQRIVRRGRRVEGPCGPLDSAGTGNFIRCGICDKAPHDHPAAFGSLVLASDDRPACAHEQALRKLAKTGHGKILERCVRGGRSQKRMIGRKRPCGQLRRGRRLFCLRIERRAPQYFALGIANQDNIDALIDEQLGRQIGIDISPIAIRREFVGLIPGGQLMAEFAQARHFLLQRRDAARNIFVRFDFSQAFELGIHQALRDGMAAKRQNGGESQRNRQDFGAQGHGACLQAQAGCNQSCRPRSAFNRPNSSRNA
ncbi:MAG: hypothetical protein BWZ10_01915 [candidate division BRC1 bacterium ADurb.BinA364]|nr:MAG: hypothetical protein BWZ10_01915 [candidate division BRC1 bacterium ADurb.BinA364]